MNTNVMSNSQFQHRKVKVAYKVKVFCAHCPSCGRARMCRHEPDGSFTLICGCRSDGADAVKYLVDAEDVFARDETRVKYLNVYDDDQLEADD